MRLYEYGFALMMTTEFSNHSALTIEGIFKIIPSKIFLNYVYFLIVGLFDKDVKA